MPDQSNTLDPAMFSGSTKSCACFNLRRASRAISQFYDAHFEDAGLRVTQ